jgi:hypothetical protein
MGAPVTSATQKFEIYGRFDLARGRMSRRDEDAIRLFHELGIDIPEQNRRQVIRMLKAGGITFEKLTTLAGRKNELGAAAEPIPSFIFQAVFGTKINNISELERAVARLRNIAGRTNHNIADLCNDPACLQNELSDFTIGRKAFQLLSSEEGLGIAFEGADTQQGQSRIEQEIAIAIENGGISFRQLSHLAGQKNEWNQEADPIRENCFRILFGQRINGLEELRNAIKTIKKAAEFAHISYSAMCKKFRESDSFEQLDLDPQSLLETIISASGTGVFTYEEISSFQEVSKTKNREKIISAINNLYRIYLARKKNAEISAIPLIQALLLCPLGVKAFEQEKDPVIIILNYLALNNNLEQGVKNRLMVAFTKGGEISDNDMTLFLTEALEISDINGSKFQKAVEETKGSAVYYLYSFALKINNGERRSSLVEQCRSTDGSAFASRHVTVSAFKKANAKDFAFSYPLAAFNYTLGTFQNDTIPNVITIDSMKILIEKLKEAGSDDQVKIHWPINSSEKKILLALAADSPEVTGKLLRRLAENAYLDQHELKILSELASRSGLSSEQKLLIDRIRRSARSDSLAGLEDKQSIQALIKWMSDNNAEITVEDIYRTNRTEGRYAEKRYIEGMRILRRYVRANAEKGVWFSTYTRGSVHRTVAEKAIREALAIVKANLTQSVTPPKVQGMDQIPTWKLIQFKKQYLIEKGLYDGFKEALDTLNNELMAAQGDTAKKECRRRINEEMSWLMSVDYDFMKWFVNNYVEQDGFIDTLKGAVTFANVELLSGGTTDGFIDPVSGERIYLKDLPLLLGGALSEKSVTEELRSSGWNIDMLGDISQGREASVKVRQAFVTLLTFMKVSREKIGSVSSLRLAGDYAGSSAAAAIGVTPVADFGSQLKDLLFSISSEGKKVELMPMNFTQEANQVNRYQIERLMNQLRGDVHGSFAEKFLISLDETDKSYIDAIAALREALRKNSTGEDAVRRLVTRHDKFLKIKNEIEKRLRMIDSKYVQQLGILAGKLADGRSITVDDRHLGDDDVRLVIQSTFVLFSLINDFQKLSQDLVGLSSGESAMVLDGDLPGFGAGGVEVKKTSLWTRGLNGIADYTFPWLKSGWRDQCQNPNFNRAVRTPMGDFIGVKNTAFNLAVSAWNLPINPVSFRVMTTDFYFGGIMSAQIYFLLPYQFVKEIVSAAGGAYRLKLDAEGQLVYDEMGAPVIEKVDLGDVAAMGWQTASGMAAFGNWAPMFYGSLGIWDDIARGAYVLAYTKFNIANFYLMNHPNGFWQSTMGKTLTLDRYIFRICNAFGAHFDKFSRQGLIGTGVERFSNSEAGARFNDVLDREIFGSSVKARELIHFMFDAKGAMQTRMQAIMESPSAGKTLKKVAEGYVKVTEFETKLFYQYLNPADRAQVAIRWGRHLGNNTVRSVRASRKLRTIMPNDPELIRESVRRELEASILPGNLDNSAARMEIEGNSARAFTGVTFDDRGVRSLYGWRENLKGLFGDYQMAVRLNGSDSPLTLGIRKIHLGDADAYSSYPVSYTVHRPAVGAPESDHWLEVHINRSAVENEKMALIGASVEFAGKLREKGFEAGKDYSFNEEGRLVIKTEEVSGILDEIADRYSIESDILMKNLLVEGSDYHIENQRTVLERSGNEKIGRFIWEGNGKGWVEDMMRRAETEGASFQENSARPLKKEAILSILRERGVNNELAEKIAAEGEKFLIDQEVLGRLVQSIRSGKGSQNAEDIVHDAVRDCILRQAWGISSFRQLEEQKRVIADVYYGIDKDKLVLEVGKHYTVSEEMGRGEVRRRRIQFTPEGREFIKSYVSGIGQKTGARESAEALERRLNALDRMYEKIELLYEAYEFTKEVNSRYENGPVKDFNNRALERASEALVKKGFENQGQISLEGKKEAAILWRRAHQFVFNQDPFREQIMAGYLSSTGNRDVGIAINQDTGEGKTRVCSLAEYLQVVDGFRALYTSHTESSARTAYEGDNGGKAVRHIMDALGVRSAFISRNDVAKRGKYRRAMVIYMDFETLHFDRLHDEMTSNPSEKILPPDLQNYKLVPDEFDYTMFFNKNTPAVLIMDLPGVSAQAKAHDARFVEIADKIVGELFSRETGQCRISGYFELDHGRQDVAITSAGKDFISERIKASGARYDDIMPRIIESVKAYAFYIQGMDYNVENGLFGGKGRAIVLLNEGTHREMGGRQLSAEINKALCQKEGLRVVDGGLSSVQVSVSATIAPFGGIIGFSGTNFPLAEYFGREGILSIPVPPHIPQTRVDHSTLLCRTMADQVKAAAIRVISDFADGKPVMIKAGAETGSGIISIERIMDEVKFIMEIARSGPGNIDAEKIMRGLDSNVVERMKKIYGPDVIEALTRTYSDTIETARTACGEFARQGIDINLLELTGKNADAMEARIVANMGKPGTIVGTTVISRAVDAKLKKRISGLSGGFSLINLSMDVDSCDLIQQLGRVARTNPGKGTRDEGSTWSIFSLEDPYWTSNPQESRYVVHLFERGGKKYLIVADGMHPTGEGDIRAVAEAEEKKFFSMLGISENDRDIEIYDAIQRSVEKMRREELWQQDASVQAVNQVEQAISEVKDFIKDAGLFSYVESRIKESYLNPNGFGPDMPRSGRNTDGLISNLHERIGIELRAEDIKNASYYEVLERIQEAVRKAGVDAVASSLGAKKETKIRRRIDRSGGVWLLKASAHKIADQRLDLGLRQGATYDEIFEEFRKLTGLRISIEGITPEIRPWQVRDAMHEAIENAFLDFKDNPLATHRIRQWADKQLNLLQNNRISFAQDHLSREQGKITGETDIDSIRRTGLSSYIQNEFFTAMIGGRTRNGMFSGILGMDEVRRGGRVVKIGYSEGVTPKKYARRSFGRSRTGGAAVQGVNTGNFSALQYLERDIGQAIKTGQREVVVDKKGTFVLGDEEGVKQLNAVLSEMGSKRMIYMKPGVGCIYGEKAEGLNSDNRYVFVYEESSNIPQNITGFVTSDGTIVVRMSRCKEIYEGLRKVTTSQRDANPGLCAEVEKLLSAYGIKKESVSEGAEKTIVTDIARLVIWHEESHDKLGLSGGFDNWGKNLDASYRGLLSNIREILADFGPNGPLARIVELSKTDPDQANRLFQLYRAHAISEAKTYGRTVPNVFNLREYFLRDIAGGGQSDFGGIEKKINEVYTVLASHHSDLVARLGELQGTPADVRARGNMIVDERTDELVHRLENNLPLEAVARPAAEPVNAARPAVDLSRTAELPGRIQEQFAQPRKVSLQEIRRITGEVVDRPVPAAETRAPFSVRDSLGGAVVGGLIGLGSEANNGFAPGWAGRTIDSVNQSAYYGLRDNSALFGWGRVIPSAGRAAAEYNMFPSWSSFNRLYHGRLAALPLFATGVADGVQRAFTGVIMINKKPLDLSGLYMSDDPYDQEAFFSIMVFVMTKEVISNYGFEYGNLFTSMLFGRIPGLVKLLGPLQKALGVATGVAFVQALSKAGDLAIIPVVKKIMARAERNKKIYNGISERLKKRLMRLPNETEIQAAIAQYNSTEEGKKAPIEYRKGVTRKTLEKHLMTLRWINSSFAVISSGVGEAVTWHYAVKPVVTRVTPFMLERLGAKKAGRWLAGRAIGGTAAGASIASVVWPLLVLDFAGDVVNIAKDFTDPAQVAIYNYIICGGIGPVTGEQAAEASFIRGSKEITVDMSKLFMQLGYFESHKKEIIERYFWGDEKKWDEMMSAIERRDLKYFKQHNIFAVTMKTVGNAMVICGVENETQDALKTPEMLALEKLIRSAYAQFVLDASSSNMDVPEMYHGNLAGSGKKQYVGRLREYYRSYLISTGIQKEQAERMSANINDVSEVQIQYFAGLKQYIKSRYNNDLDMLYRPSGIKWQYGRGMDLGEPILQKGFMEEDVQFTPAVASTLVSMAQAQMLKEHGSQEKVISKEEAGKPIFSYLEEVYGALDDNKMGELLVLFTTVNRGISIFDTLKEGQVIYLPKKFLPPNWGMSQEEIAEANVAIRNGQVSNISSSCNSSSNVGQIRRVEISSRVEPIQRLSFGTNNHVNGRSEFK